MLSLFQNEPVGNEQLSFNQQISNQLYENGWSVIDQYFPEKTIHELRLASHQLAETSAFRPAGIKNSEVNSSERCDFISWINPETCGPVHLDVLHRFEKLRLHLNRENQLGLFDLELHASIYPVNGFYKKHLDNFQDSSDRILTVILYLNQEWTPDDAGQLCIYLKNNMSINIDPIGGRLVTFFSDTFTHEVLPTNAERYSLTGWFRKSDLPV